MKITQDYKNCIGCGSCVAVCPKYWELDEAGKAKLKGGKERDGLFELEADEKSADCNKIAKDSCPAGVIRLE